MIPQKHVYANGRFVGFARTWGKVAQLLGDPRDGATLSREGSESPTAFYVNQLAAIPTFPAAGRGPDQPGRNAVGAAQPKGDR